MATLTPARTRQPNQPINRAPRKRLPFPVGLYQSAVGKKWVMAVTGIMLLGFVVVHMIGNLHMYEGPERFNEYGEALRDLGGHLIPRTFALWGLRLGLVGAFALHIHAAVTLTLMNKRARPTRYQAPRTYVAASYASRSMRYTGIIILLYLIFHLADLTWGWFLGDNYIRGDVYNNVTRSLSNIPVAIIYIVANIASGGAHLPRRLEPLSEPGLEQPPLQQGAPRLCTRPGRRHSFGEPVLPDHEPRRRGRPGQPHHRMPRAQGRRNDHLPRGGRVNDGLSGRKGPRGPHRRAVDQPQVQPEAGQPGEQASL